MSFESKVEWIINGQQLDYFNQKVLVKPKEVGFDTILYKNKYLKEFREVICKIPKEGKFVFVTNPCCGGFNVEGPNCEVNVSILGEFDNRRQSKLIGMYGETGTIINSKDETKLSTECRSAMSSNVCKIALLEIEDCREPPHSCKVMHCLSGPDADKYIFEYEYTYKEVVNILNLNYLPLDVHTVDITYNLTKGEILLNGIRIK